MVKLLKYENSFTPCPVKAEDELFAIGIFEFNITEILKYIKANSDSVRLEEIRVSDFFQEFSSINESHVEWVDVSQPVILAEIAPEQYNLIDGNHRMEKARRMGMKCLPAYKLNAEQHLRFLTDQKAYLAYVEYWNSKLK